MAQALDGIRSKIEDIKSDKNRKGFSPDEIESLTTRVSELSISDEEYAKEHELPTTLNYKQRPARHENIIDAHKKTFSWILSNLTPKPVRLAAWLNG